MLVGHIYRFMISDCREITKLLVKFRVGAMHYVP